MRTRVVIPFLLTVACDAAREPAAPRVSDAPTERMPFASSLSIVPSKARINTGDMLRLDIVAFDAQRRVLPRAALTWSSSDSTIARVNEYGVVHARSAGYVAITATSGATTAAALLQIAVAGEYPATVALDGLPSAMSACESVQLRAHTDPDIGDTRFRWSSSDEQVFSIEQTGLLRGVGAGTATLMVVWSPDSSRRASRPLTITSCAR